MRRALTGWIVLAVGFLGLGLGAVIVGGGMALLTLLLVVDLVRYRARHAGKLQVP